MNNETAIKAGAAVVVAIAIYKISEHISTRKLRQAHKEMTETALGFARVNVYLSERLDAAKVPMTEFDEIVMNYMQ